MRQTPLPGPSPGPLSPLVQEAPLPATAGHSYGPSGPMKTPPPTPLYEQHREGKRQERRLWAEDDSWVVTWDLDTLGDLAGDQDWGQYSRLRSVQTCPTG